MLVEHYEAMKRYMSFLDSKVDPANGILNEGPLGDWLSPEGNKNDNTLFWMTYQAYSLQIMTKVAKLLAKTADAQVYQVQFDAKKKLINQIYVDPTSHKIVKSGVRAARMGPPGAAPAPTTTAVISDRGQVMDTQASYAIPLGLGMIEESLVPDVTQHLLETIQRSSKDDEGKLRPAFSLMTGFIGTASISEALSANGHHEEAYRLLTQKTYPSWLYSVANGASTIWERLNSFTQENGFGGNNSMNSFNHYSFGAVAAWMYTRSLGIERDENSPGFKHFILQPTPDPTGKISFAKGFVETMYGKISSEWKKEGNKMSYHFRIPANTSAQLRLIAPKGARITDRNKVIRAKETSTGFQIELGSGIYHLMVE